MVRCYGMEVATGPTRETMDLNIRQQNPDTSNHSGPQKPAPRRLLSDPDERTIRAGDVSSRDAPATASLYTKEESPSASRASLVAEQRLEGFFAASADALVRTTKYTDADLLEIASLLRRSNQERWSAAPRIYTVLRNIDQVPLMEDFIREGFSDIWFPFTNRNLPPKLPPSIKAQFLSVQSLVLTQALDIEKEGGSHANFATDEPVCFESIGKLGKGAFGVVDKVVSLITLQEYARKRMRRGQNFTKSKREIKEFKAELAILKTVNHQHCVKLVGSYTDPIYLGLIMAPVADCMLTPFKS